MDYQGERHTQPIPAVGDDEPPRRPAPGGRRGRGPAPAATGGFPAAGPVSTGSFPAHRELPGRGHGQFSGGRRRDRRAAGRRSGPDPHAGLPARLVRAVSRCPLDGGHAGQRDGRRPGRDRGAGTGGRVRRRGRPAPAARQQADRDEPVAAGLDGGRGRGAPRGRRAGGLQVPVRAAGERPGVRVAAAADQRLGLARVRRGPGQVAAHRQPVPGPRGADAGRAVPGPVRAERRLVHPGRRVDQQGLHAGGVRLRPAEGAGSRQVHPAAAGQLRLGRRHHDGHHRGGQPEQLDRRAEGGPGHREERDHRAARRAEGADQEDRHRDGRGAGRDQGPLPDLDVGPARPA